MEKGIWLPGMNPTWEMLGKAREDGFPARSFLHEAFIKHLLCVPGAGDIAVIKGGKVPAV